MKTTIVMLCVAGALGQAGAAAAVSDEYLGVGPGEDARGAIRAAAATGDWARAGWLELVYGGDEDAAEGYFGRATATGDDPAAWEGKSWLDFLRGRMDEAYAGRWRYLAVAPAGDAAPALVGTFNMFDGCVSEYVDGAEALIRLSHNPAASPAVRAGAARAAEPILADSGRWEEAERYAAEQGYVGAFDVCGVFRRAGITDIEYPFEPEKRITPAPAVTAGERVWRPVKAALGRVDIGGALGFNYGVAYATTVIDLAPGSYIVEVASDDWYRVWLNDAEVVRRHPRDSSTATRKRARFTTSGGRVRVLVKTLQNNGGVLRTDDKWDFKIRFLRADGFTPVRGEDEARGLKGNAKVEVTPVAPLPPAGGAMGAFYRGWESYEAGDYVAGVAAMDEALAAAPKCTLFMLGAAVVRITAGGQYYLAEAKTLLRRAQGEDPRCVLAVEELAVFASVEGKRDAAVELYRDTLSTEPAYVSSVAGLATIASREGWEGEFLRLIDDALTLVPTSHRALRLAGDYYYDRDNFERAAAYYEQVLRVKATDAEARSRLAEIFAQRGDWDRVRGEYETILRTDPYHERAWMGMARTAVRAGKAAEANELYAAAAAALPRAASLRKEWGHYLIGQGESERGRKILYEAWRLDGSDWRLRRYLEREGVLKKDAVDRFLEADYKEAKAPAGLAQKYPHANTAMLLDQTTVFLNNDFTFRESNRNLIYILNDKGRERWGEITILSDEGTELIAARTRLPGGETVDAVSVKDSGGYKIISMEKVGAGVTLDVAYDLNVARRLVFNLLEYYSPPFYLGEIGETLLTTRFAVVVPDDFGARDRLHFAVRNGRVKARRIRGDNRTAYVFERRNVDAYEEEPMMPSRDAFLPYVRATTFTSLDTLAEWYRGELWGKMTADAYLRRLLSEIDLPAGDDRARAAAVYYYVINHVGSSGGNVYYPAPARLTAFRGSGRTLDRAVLICALCRELGIAAKVALVGTGASKGEWEIITPDMFDTVLVYFPTLGEGGTYADPLIDNLAFGDVWTACYGKPTLIVDEDGYDVGRVPGAPFERDAISLEMTVTLSHGGNGRFEGRRVYRGLRGAYRESFNTPEDRKNNVEISLSQLFDAANIDTFDFENLRDRSKEFALVFTGDAPNYAKQRGERLTLKAAPYPFQLGQVFVSGETRRYPLRVDRPEAWADDVRIVLPAGYAGEGLPLKKELEGPQSKYSLSVAEENGVVHIMRTLFIDQGDVAVADYPAFVRFCREVDKVERTEIICTPNRGKER